MCPEMFKIKMELRGAQILTYLTEPSALLLLNWVTIERAGMSICSTTMIDCNGKTDKPYEDEAINTWKTTCDMSKVCRVVECEGNQRNLKSKLSP
jgi:hypothetical protein